MAQTCTAEGILGAVVVSFRAGRRLMARRENHNQDGNGGIPGELREKMVYETQCEGCARDLSFDYSDTGAPHANHIWVHLCSLWMYQRYIT